MLCRHVDEGGTVGNCTSQLNNINFYRNITFPLIGDQMFMQPRPTQYRGLKNGALVVQSNGDQTWCTLAISFDCIFF